MFNLEGNFLRSAINVITGIIFTHVSLVIFSGGKFRPIDWLDSIKHAPSIGVAAIVLMILSFICFYLANLFRIKNEVR